MRAPRFTLLKVSLPLGIRYIVRQRAYMHKQKNFLGRAANMPYMGSPIRPGERPDDTAEPLCSCGAKSTTDCDECWGELCSDCAVAYGSKHLCVKCNAKMEAMVP